MRKGHLTKKFQKSASTIPYARDARTGNIVRLPGSAEQGDWYDESLHKGNLICGCCSASVHLNKGSVTSDGSRGKGSDAHFKTNPGKEHEKNCGFEVEKRNYARPDGSDGYRLNFNTSTSDYFRPKRKSIVPAGLPGISLKSVFDLAAFMRTHNPLEVSKSFAVFREHESAFRYFLWSDKHDPYRRNLIKTVEKMIEHKRTTQLGSLELEVEGKNIKQGFKALDKTYIRGKSIHLGVDKDGIKHMLLPRYSIDRRNCDEEEMRALFREDDTYFAQGLGLLSTRVQGKTHLHFLEMPLITPDQVMKTSIAKIEHENHVFHQQKHKGTDLTP